MNATFTELGYVTRIENREDVSTWLYECSVCSAAVVDREKHNRSHTMSRIGFS